MNDSIKYIILTINQIYIYILSLFIYICKIIRAGLYMKTCLKNSKGITNVWKELSSIKLIDGQIHIVKNRGKNGLIKGELLTLM